MLKLLATSYRSSVLRRASLIVSLPLRCPTTTLHPTPSGLPACVFAAAVPNNYPRRVRDLVQEVHADHDAMVSETVSDRAGPSGCECIQSASSGWNCHSGCTLGITPLALLLICELLIVV